MNQTPNSSGKNTPILLTPILSKASNNLNLTTRDSDICITDINIGRYNPLLGLLLTSPIYPCCASYVTFADGYMEPIVYFQIKMALICEMILAHLLDSPAVPGIAL